jgi:hypothetical protein
MHEINYIDRTFKQEAAEEHSLLIQVNKKGLSYCIYNPESENYVVFRRKRFEQVIMTGDLVRQTEEALTTDDLLSLPFRKVSFAGYTQQTTLVPGEFYDQNAIDKYLEFNQGEDIHISVFSNHIPEAGLYNVFALPEELVSLVSMHFGKVEFLSQTTPFIRHIAVQPDHFTENCMFLGLYPEFFDIACTGSSKLRIYNTFQYANENDLLYYLLLVFQKMGLDPAKTPLRISGEQGSKLSYWDLISQYVRDCRYDEPAEIPALSSGLKQLVSSRFLNLLNLQMCGSSVENTAGEGLR